MVSGGPGANGLQQPYGVHIYSASVEALWDFFFFFFESRVSASELCLRKMHLEAGMWGKAQGGEVWEWTGNQRSGTRDEALHSGRLDEDAQEQGL